MFLTTVFRNGHRDRDIASRAAEQGVRAFPLSALYMGRARLQGLVLGYGAFQAAEIDEGVRRLRTILDGVSPH